MEKKKEQKTICIIGSTGVGKSATCNTLTGTNGFHVSPGLDSDTFATESKIAYFRGNPDRPFEIVDTPGLGDSHGGDSINIARMVNHLQNEVKSVHLFLVLFNGGSPRLDEHLGSMLEIFAKIFGSNFFNNAALVFTRWPLDKASKRRRRKAGTSEEERKRDFSEKLMEFTNGRHPPCFFIENSYNMMEAEEEAELDENEMSEFNDQMEQLWSHLDQQKPFECEDINAVKGKSDALKEKYDKEIQKYQASIDQDRKKIKGLEALVATSKGNDEKIRKLGEQILSLTKSVEEKQEALKKANSCCFSFGSEVIRRNGPIVDKISIENLKEEDQLLGYNPKTNQLFWDDIALVNAEQYLSHDGFIEINLTAPCGEQYTLKLQKHHYVHLSHRQGSGPLLIPSIETKVGDRMLVIELQDMLQVVDQKEENGLEEIIPVEAEVVSIQPMLSFGGVVVLPLNSECFFVGGIVASMHTVEDGPDVFYTVGRWLTRRTSKKLPRYLFNVFQWVRKGMKKVGIATHATNIEEKRNIKINLH